ncbi:MAG TPA: DLW-39 family protein [Microlunatus sp.]
MKKLLFALAVAGGVAVLVRQYNRKTAEADLWAEATDHVSPAGESSRR